MSSLEELLLDSGAMTKAQVALVREDQRIFGGSLDLNILASGYLTEHALQRILEQLWNQVGKVDFEQLPTKGAIALLDADTAGEIGAVPQSLLGQQLYVLVHDQTAVDRLAELEELADYDIVPVGINEVRLKYLLERCYGLERSERETAIMDRLMAQAAAAAERHRNVPDPLIGDPMAGLEPEWLAGAVVMSGADVDLSATIPDTGSSVMDELDPDDIPILEDELLVEVVDDEEEAALAEADADRALDDAHQGLSAEDFQPTLDAVESMEGLPEVFFRFGVDHFKSVAIFKVQSGMLMGWRGAGLGIVPELIRGIVVPVQSDTFLAKGIELSVYCGQGGSNPVEERITEQLGCTSDAYLSTAAVKVGDRPVMVVCGVTEGEQPPAVVLGELEQLSQLAAQTVLRLIMARKKAKKETVKEEPEPKPEPEPEPEAEEEAEAEGEEEAEAEGEEEGEGEEEPESEAEGEEEQDPEQESATGKTTKRKPRKKAPRRKTTATKKKKS